MCKVFFSQSVYDPRRHAIYSLLEKSFGEANVWLAEYNIQPGERWPASMKLVLSTCDLFVVLIPTEFSTSVLAECAFALLSGNQILPICNDVGQMRGYQLGSTQAIIGSDWEIEYLLSQWLQDNQGGLNEHPQVHSGKGIHKWFPLNH